MLSATSPSEELRRAQRRQHQRRHQRRKEGRGIPRLRSMRSRPKPGQWVFCETPAGPFYGIVGEYTAIGPTDSVMVIPQVTQGVFEAGLQCATPLHYVTHVANAPSKRWTTGDALRTTRVMTCAAALVAELGTYDLDPVPAALAPLLAALGMRATTVPLGHATGQVSADECPVPGQVSGLEERLAALSGPTEA